MHQVFYVAAATQRVGTCQWHFDREDVWKSLNGILHVNACFSEVWWEIGRLLGENQIEARCEMLGE